MTVIHITEERLWELLDMKADELFAALDEIKADPIQRNWVYDAEEENDDHTHTQHRHPAQQHGRS